MPPRSSPGALPLPLPPDPLLPPLLPPSKPPPPPADPMLPPLLAPPSSPPLPASDVAAVRSSSTASQGSRVTARQQCGILLGPRASPEAAQLMLQEPRTSMAGQDGRAHLVPLVLEPRACRMHSTDQNCRKSRALPACSGLGWSDRPSLGLSSFEPAHETEFSAVDEPNAPSHGLGPPSTKHAYRSRAAVQSLARTPRSWPGDGPQDQHHAGCRAVTAPRCGDGRL